MNFGSFRSCDVESPVADDVLGVEMPMVGSDMSASVLGELSVLNIVSRCASLFGGSLVSPFGSPWTSKNAVLT